MATPGVPWDCKDSVIVEHLKKAKGRLTYACKTLNVHYETLKKRIDKTPELQKILSELRNELDTTLLDSAENCLLYAMSKQDQDLGNALKSSFYVLNNKGKDRGYSAKNHPNNQPDVSTDDIASFIRQTIANNKDTEKAD